MIDPKSHINNFSTTLAEDISDSDTSFDLASVVGLPTLSGSDYVALTIDNNMGDIEIIHYLSKSGSTITCTRGAEGTTPVAFVTGTRIQGRATADSLDRKQQDLSGLTIPSATVATGDLVIIQDISDSNNIKTVTAQSIADLGGGGGGGITDIDGTTNQIVATDDGDDTYTLSLADNTVMPGNGGMVLPQGSTGSRGSNTFGRFRANTSTGYIEYNDSSAWYSLQPHLSEFTVSSATVAGDDKVLIKDTSNGDVLRYVTAQSIADLGAGGGGLTESDILGTSGVTTVTDNLDGTVTIDIADNPTISGTGGIVIPAGNTGARLATNNALRINTDTLRLEYRIGGSYSGIQLLWDADFSNGILAKTAALTYTNRTMTGTTDKITITNGDGISGNPTFTIASTYVGQTSITTLGTISAGTWEGTAIGGAYGGTGQNSTTQGDLLYGASGNAWSKLAKNTSSTRYLSNTGTNNDPAWAQIALATGVSGILPVANGGNGVSTHPYFKAGLTSSQSIANNTLTKILLDSEISDTNSNYDNITNYRFTPTVAGTYMFIGQTLYLSAVDQARYDLVVVKNGGTETATWSFQASGAGAFNQGAFVATLFSANGSTDYFELYGLHLSGASKSVAGSLITTFVGFWVGP